MPRRGTDVRSLHARRKTIAKAFAELRQRGFLALQRHTCCRSCGWYEVPEDQEHVVFYHEQDWHAFKETGVLWLAWAGDGRAVVDAFARHGLAVEWDGTPDRRIAVDFGDEAASSDSKCRR